MTTPVETLTGYATPRLTISLAAPATKAHKVGIWWGSRPHAGSVWPANLIATVPAGKDEIEVDNAAPRTPCWAASLGADGLPSHDPVAGDHPPDASCVERSLPVNRPSISMDPVPAAGGSGGGAGGCGCGSGSGGVRVRITIDIDGAAEVGTQTQRGRPSGGYGVPVRCLTGNGTGGGQTFQVQLAWKPKDHPKSDGGPLSSQFVQIFYDGQPSPTPHVVEFGADEDTKTVRSQAKGARSAGSFRGNEAQPAVSKPC